MRIKLVIVLILFLIILIGSISCGVKLEVKGSPRIITVPDDYPTIQGAINAANEGDTIFVRSGVYFENVYINKSLSLIGEDRNTTIIDGSLSEVKYQPTVLIESNCKFVSLSNFTIRGSKDNWGIYVMGGWALSGSEHYNRRTITNNIVMNNSGGIIVQDCYRCTLVGNIVRNNQYEGIAIFVSSRIIMRNNTIHHNKYNFGIVPLALGGLDFYIHDIDFSNKIDGKSIYYLINERKLIVSPQTFSDVGYLALVNSSEVTVDSTDLNGLLLAFTDYSTITHNTIHNGYTGIWLHASNNNQIVKNNITANIYGLYISWSKNNTFKENNVSMNSANFDIYGRDFEEYVQSIDDSNLLDGKKIIYLVNVSKERINPSLYPDVGYVCLVGCENVTIKDLNLYKGDIVLAYTKKSLISGCCIAEGTISLYESCCNVIRKNIVSKNWCNGIGLGRSHNNTIENNRLAYNQFGISIGDSFANVVFGNLLLKNRIGISVENSCCLIYHNAFVYNEYNAESYELSKEIRWDNGYPSGGNYWNDYKDRSPYATVIYSGPYQNETGSDGIWDYPYYIDYNNVDYYPLVHPPVLILDVPHQAQDTSDWCGPASLAMVLRYYGYYIHSWDIAQDLGLSNDEGVDLGPGNPLHKNLYDYVKNHYPELNVHLGKYSTKSEEILEDIRGNLTLGYPVIMALKLLTNGKEVYHGAVAVGYNETGFFVNDPGDALLLWTGRGQHASPIQFYVSNEELYEALYVPSWPNTGTLLIAEGNPPVEYKLSATLSLARRCAITGKVDVSDIYIYDPINEAYHYVDLDKGLTWKTLGHDKIDMNDVLYVDVHVSNHLPHEQELTAQLVITGEDGLIYYEDERKLLASPLNFEWSFMSFLWSNIPLREYLTKTQRYKIYVSLLNSTNFTVDLIETPWFDYSASYNYEMNVENLNFTATIQSNSTISNFNFTKEEKKISFMVEGELGTIGYCNITIPIELLGGPYTVTFDNETILKNYNAPTNGTHAFIYITYNHSTHTIEIIGTTVIPEYPSSALLLVSSLPITLMIVLLKKKYKIL